MFIEKTSDAVKHFRLGTMFYQGEVVDQDLVEARRQFKLGWEAKGFKSGFNYAKMLNDGVGGEQDTDTAYNIFNLVGNDYPDAYYEMYKSHHCTDKKTILYQGQVKGSRKCALELGKLTEKEGNEEEAIGAYEAAAVPPNDEIMSEACERLGLLQKKRGDIVSALNNLIYSAEKGLNESRYHLGLLYLQQGKKWSALPEFRNAKNEGHLRAEFEYFKMGISGYFYYIGADIVHDLKKLRDRCEDDELKDEIAMYLGDYYSEKGNIWEAFEWYSTAKASRKTHQILESELDSIKESMRIGTGYILLQQKVNEVMKRCPATGELMDKCHFWNGIFDENLGEYDVAMSHYEAGIVQVIV